MPLWTASWFVVVRLTLLHQTPGVMLSSLRQQTITPSAISNGKCSKSTMTIMWPTSTSDSSASEKYNLSLSYENNDPCCQ